MHLFLLEQVTSVIQECRVCGFLQSISYTSMYGISEWWEIQKPPSYAFRVTASRRRQLPKPWVECCDTPLIYEADALSSAEKNAHLQMRKLEKAVRKLLIWSCNLQLQNSKAPRCNTTPGNRKMMSKWKHAKIICLLCRRMTGGGSEHQE